MASAPPTLPPDMALFERGWLSANSIVFQGRHGTAIVDTGYHSHGAQTVELVRAALSGRPLERIINTHLHSDHCGGNAALQSAWPEAQTAIPPGLAAFVRDWDPYALSYTPTGQECPRFQIDGVLQPGSEIPLGDRLWQVHAAPGHDPHALLLFEPQERLLISADALWANGFGVVFPELEGESAFAEVGATFDVIKSLQPRLVLPGHGPMFSDVARALDTARRRLEGFMQDPRKHALYAAKVLLKYKLLEWQQITLDDVCAWGEGTPYFCMLHENHFADQGRHAWLESLADELVRSGAARREGGVLVNA